MVFTLRDGYDKSKHPTEHLYRWAERTDIPMSGVILFKSMDGTARRGRLSGMVRTWKRDPNRIEFPMKYGMYESTTYRLLDDGRVGNGETYMVVRLTDEEARRWYETDSTEEVSQ